MSIQAATKLQEQKTQLSLGWGRPYWLSLKKYLIFDKTITKNLSQFSRDAQKPIAVPGQ